MTTTTNISVLYAISLGSGNRQLSFTCSLQHQFLGPSQHQRNLETTSDGGAAPSGQSLLCCSSYKFKGDMNMKCKNYANDVTNQPLSSQKLFALDVT